MNKLGALIICVLFVATTSAQSFTPVYNWMHDNGLTTMTSESAFRPNDGVSRGEIAKFFNEFAVLQGLSKTKTPDECQFNDILEYDSTLIPHIISACEYGLVKGSQGNYYPNKQLTEAEALTVVVRAIAGMQDESGDPRRKETHKIAKNLRIIDNESIWDLSQNALRGKVGTWLWRTTQSNTENIDNNILKDDVVIENKKEFGNGTHIVGTDIQPGTYRSNGTTSCYWARLSGFGGELDDIIANGNNSQEIITISENDKAFQSTNCGQWIEIESSYPTTPATAFSDGTYEVGKHIESGTYRATGNPDDMCYWARLSSFSQSGIKGVITNGNSPTIIEISESDKGFKNYGCGDREKI